MIVYLNGRYVDANKAKISVFDQGFLYGNGVYETLRTYGGKVWQMNYHLKRLTGSMKVAGVMSTFSRIEMAEIIEKTLKKNGFREARIRVTVTPGAVSGYGVRFRPAGSGRAGPASVASGKASITTGDPKPTVVVNVYRLPIWRANLQLDPEKAIFFETERMFPAVKSTSLFPQVVARMESSKYGAVDAILVNHDGHVTEGAATNVFCVKKGVLLTPDAEILFGTTRDFLLKLAKKCCTVKYCCLSRADLESADEVFLTNAPRGIIPIVKIGARRVGNGRVGPLTQALHQLFDAEIQRFIGK